ncbi:hypothetical protein EDB19DRAFT_446054 [Suillus lakei]|nr:hypothetical protein EDB19DRAFT_446054 [Suillus lakei]
METTAEQQSTELSTDALASKDSQILISATPCAYTQVLVDPSRAENKLASENNQASLQSIPAYRIADPCVCMRIYAQLAEESLASQLLPDFSPPPPHLSDLNAPEHDIGSSAPIHVTEPTTNTLCSAAMSRITTNERILQTDETLNASLSPFISRRGTPHVELADTNDLQIIRSQSSGMSVQLPHFQSCEVDEEAPSNSLDNGRIVFFASQLQPSPDFFFVPARILSVVAHRNWR